MPDAGSLAGWLRLTLTPGIGGETQRKLLRTFGLPEAIYAASRSALCGVISERMVDSLLASDHAAAVSAALAWCDKPDRHIVTLADSEYPQALLEIADPPTLLYVHGRLELLNTPALAIVGSRSATPQGIQNAEEFAAAFSGAGLTIVSGLALGIDGAAHCGALSAKGDTLAVIGTGIDRIYPARNHELAQEIGRSGAIVSEFRLGTSAAAANFPRRNRLISGLSRGVLVVEAALRSGSLITARLAAEQGREVFAIPGSIHSPHSRGCHALIKQGAKLVETAQDVLDELRWPQPAIAVTRKADDTTCAASIVLAGMGFDPCGIDELAERCDLTADALSVALLHLELDGQIASLPGSRYQRLPDR